MFKLDEKDFIVCWWFAESFEGDNFLMLLHKADEHWLIDYRFRYKQDDKTFDSADKKSFYQAKLQSTVPEVKARETCQEVYQKIREKFCCKCFQQEVNGGVDKFIETLQRYPDLFHQKIEKAS